MTVNDIKEKLLMSQFVKPKRKAKETVTLPMKLAERIGVLYAALVLSDGCEKQASYLKPVWASIKDDVEAVFRSKWMKRYRTKV